MKKNLFNFAKAFLLGLAFVAVGCSDYDEDIKDLNNRIDEVIAGKIDPLKMDLDKAVANLTAAQAALETEIKAAHDADVATLKASDASLSEAISAANAAIVDLKAALNTRIDGVEANFAEQIANASAEIAAVNSRVDAANALIEGLQSDVAALNVKDTELAAEIAGLKDQLAALNTELKDLISKNASDIANNASDIAANEAAIKAINENLANQVAVFTEFKSAVEGKIAALEAQDAAFAEAIATINGSIKTLQDTKLDVTNFEAYKAEVAGLFDAVNNSLMSMNMAIVNLQAADKDLTKKISNLQKEMNEQFMNAFMQITTNAANIAAVKSDVAKNKKAIEANATAIAKVNADLIAAVSALEAKDAEITADVEAKYNALVKEDAALKALIDGLDADLQAKYKALVAEDEALAAQISKVAGDLADAVAALEAEDDVLAQAIEDLGVKLTNDIEALKKDVAAKFIELANKDKELAEKISANATKIASVGQKVDEIEKQHAEFEKAFTIWKGQLHETILAIEKKDMEQDGALNLVNENLNKAIAKAEAELKAAAAQLQAAIDAANVNINKLASRVQSIVYIPEYLDGCATVHYAMLVSDNSEKIIEGASTIKYQIYPADCAADIVALFNGGETGILDFDVKSVKSAYTRSAEEEEAADFNITKVEDLGEGVIELTFEARNLAEAFYNELGYTAEGGYAASLVLNYEGTEAAAAANLSSCYTQFVPSNRTTAMISVDLYQDVEPVSGMVEEKEIEYTRRNAPGVALEEYETVEILKGLYVGYTIDGVDGVFTWKEMAEKGYAITAPAFQYDVTATDPNNADADALTYFSYDTIYSPAETANVLAAKAEFAANDAVQPIVSLTDKAIAETVGSVLTYTAKYNAMGVELEATSNVKVAPNKIEIAATVADIVWNYDADAEQDAVAGEKDYKRTGLALEISDELDESGNPIKLDGVKLTDLVSTGWSGLQGLNGATAKLAVVDGGVVLNINKFKWNSTYDLVYTFKNHPSVEVVFTVTVKTIDRSREVVKIEASADVALTKDITFASIDGKDMKLNDIFGKLTYDLGSFAGKEDAFLKEVLVNKAYTQTVTVKAGDVAAATDKAAFTVNKAAYTANVSFAYDAFNFVPDVVTYTKNITLWYGQEVKLVYTVNFKEPAAGYRFMHNDLWVFGDDNTGYASQVQGRYVANDGSISKFTKELVSFSVDNINMDQAFYVYSNGNMEKPLTPAELTAAGIVTEFFFVKKPANANIKFKEAGGVTTNIIEYNGDDDFVNVNGNLYLVHSNGAKYKINTEFDNGIYSSYRVLKFDPFTEFEVRNDTTNVIEVKKYTIDVDELFDVYESRDGSGNATVIDGDQKVDLIKGNDWYVGDKNGWYTDKQYGDIYPGLKKGYNNVYQQIPDRYRNAFGWDEATGVLTFDNTFNMKLSTPVEFEVIMTIEYAWGKKVSKAAVIRFTTPELESKE